MKSATILREPLPLLHPDEGTFGILKTDDGLLSFVSMELPWRDVNRDGIGDPQKSCITAGVYLCKWLNHPKHGWCYEVTGVIQRSAILIHAAGFAGDFDKGWQADLEGCISVGYQKGTATNKFGNVQRALLRSPSGQRSADAVAELNAWGNRESFLLQIIEAG